MFYLLQRVWLKKPKLLTTPIFSISHHITISLLKRRDLMKIIRKADGVNVRLPIVIINKVWFCMYQCIIIVQSLFIICWMNGYKSCHLILVFSFFSLTSRIIFTTSYYGVFWLVTSKNCKGTLTTRIKYPLLKIWSTLHLFNQHLPNAVSCSKNNTWRNQGGSTDVILFRFFVLDNIL